MPAKLTKTGECYYRAADGSLWVAESYVDADGAVLTQDVEVEPASDDQE
jgi:hypothetical protein